MEINRTFLNEIAKLLGPEWSVRKDQHDRDFLVHVPSGGYLWVTRSWRGNNRITISPGWHCSYPWIQPAVNYQATGNNGYIAYYIKESDRVGDITVKPDADPVYCAKHIQRRILKKGYLLQFQRAIAKVRGNARKGFEKLELLEELAEILEAEVPECYRNGTKDLNYASFHESWFSNPKHDFGIKSFEVKTLSDTVEMHLRWVEPELAKRICHAIARYRQEKQQGDQPDSEVI